MIERVAGCFYQRLPRHRVGYAGKVAEHRSQKPQNAQEYRDAPHMGTQSFHAAHEIQNPQRPSAQRGRGVPDHRVHRDTDDLGDDKIAHRKQRAGEDADKEIPSAAPEQQPQGAPRPGAGSRFVHGYHRKYTDCPHYSTTGVKNAIIAAAISS